MSCPTCGKILTKEVIVYADAWNYQLTGTVAGGSVAFSGASQITDAAAIAAARAVLDSYDFSTLNWGDSIQDCTASSLPINTTAAAAAGAVVISSQIIKFLDTVIDYGLDSYEASQSISQPRGPGPAYGFPFQGYPSGTSTPILNSSGADSGLSPPCYVSTNAPNSVSFWRLSKKMVATAGYRTSVQYSGQPPYATDSNSSDQNYGTYGYGTLPFQSTQFQPCENNYNAADGLLTTIIDPTDGICLPLPPSFYGGAPGGGTRDASGNAWAGGGGAELSESLFYTPCFSCSNPCPGSAPAPTSLSSPYFYEFYGGSLCYSFPSYFTPAS